MCCKIQEKKVVLLAAGQALYSTFVGEVPLVEWEVDMRIADKSKATKLVN